VKNKVHPVLISKTIHTETGHRLMCHAGKCRNLHGHSYQWTASIMGEVEESTGMVIDFAQLKEVMRSVIMVFDHRMLLHRDDPLIESLDAGLGVVAVNYHPTAEMLCRTAAYGIARGLYSLLGDRALRFLVSVAVRETHSSEAYFAIPVEDVVLEGAD